MEGFEKADIDAEHTDEIFVFFVYGHTPEFMPHVATRKDKHFDVKDKKIVKCPYCRKVFATIDKTERVELYRHTTKSKGKVHTSMSCQTCRSTVGVIYACA